MISGKNLLNLIKLQADRNAKLKKKIKQLQEFCRTILSQRFKI